MKIKCQCCGGEIPARTLGRNNHYWLCMSVIGGHIGCSKEFASDIVKTKFKWFEDKNYDGEIIRHFQSTTQWSNQQFDENFEEYKIWVAETYGVVLLSRVEYMEKLEAKAEASMPLVGGDE